jgi:hypothetical protein
MIHPRVRDIPFTKAQVACKNIGQHKNLVIAKSHHNFIFQKKMKKEFCLPFRQ